jgi:hypothetical protein
MQMYIRLLFAVLAKLWSSAFLPQPANNLVVTCNRREAPANIKAFPFQSIVVCCPLCGDPHSRVRKQVGKLAGDGPQ